MEQSELFSRLGIALAIGLLIGLERGWQLREEAEGERTAGLRTHALAGLLGGASAAVGMVSSPVFLAASFLAFSCTFTLFSWYEATVDRNFSVTGVVAGILTFTLGAYAVLGEPIIAVAAAVAMAVLLALKQPLHSWIKRLSWAELRAVLVLLAMTFLLLPVLPDTPIDPWGTVNPAEIWLMAILVAAMSFTGYVAIRLTGDHAGVILAGLAGGLASSTATTLSLARMAREHEASRLLAAGILLAGVTMMARIAIIAALFNRALLEAIFVALAAGALVLLAATSLLLRRASDRAANLSVALRNPFELLTALKLAALIAIVMILAEVLARHFGGSGVLPLAALSGLVDVDALTLSMARQAPSDIGVAIAADAVLLCAGVNTAAKGAITLIVGGQRIGLIVIAASVLAILALVGGRAMTAV